MRSKSVPPKQKSTRNRKGSDDAIRCYNRFGTEDIMEVVVDVHPDPKPQHPRSPIKPP